MVPGDLVEPGFPKFLFELRDGQFITPDLTCPLTLCQP